MYFMWLRRAVGVQGDQRTHSNVVALRAVTSADGMTADWYPFLPDFLRTVSTRICILCALSTALSMMLRLSRLGPLSGSETAFGNGSGTAFYVGVV